MKVICSICSSFTAILTTTDQTSGVRCRRWKLTPLRWENVNMFVRKNWLRDTIHADQCSSNSAGAVGRRNYLAQLVPNCNWTMLRHTNTSGFVFVPVLFFSLSGDINRDNKHIISCSEVPAKRLHMCFLAPHPRSADYTRKHCWSHCYCTSMHPVGWSVLVLTAFAAVHSSGSQPRVLSVCENSHDSAFYCVSSKWGASSPKCFSGMTPFGSFLTNSWQNNDRFMW